MKSEIIQSDSDGPIQIYPYLGKIKSDDKDDNLTVLFISKSTGMVVAAGGCYDVGHFSEEWDEEQFYQLPDNVVVKLSNGWFDRRLIINY